MLPRKKQKPRMGVKEPAREYPQHRAWVRTFACSVPGCDGLPIEAAHVRKGVPADEAGGTGMKPHDKWCVSLCHSHHDEQHTIGETSFAEKYHIDLPTKARAFARMSPHRWRWEERDAA